MAVHPDLLKAARDAQARLVDAERAMDIARAEFRHAVRRMHLGGGSLREIADALGLSHQRVHQIVEEAGGTRPTWRSFTRRGPAQGGDQPPECSFCGKGQRQVRKLIAGTGVYICEQCIDTADRVIATGEAAATALSALTSVDETVAAAKCSFCGKRRVQVSGLAAAAGGTICTECLSLCHEINDESDELPR